MAHKIYKVVKLAYYTQRDGVRRQRISCGIRHPDFTTIYPVAEWVTMPIGLSFVFIDEQAARGFYDIYKATGLHNESHFLSELWLCMSEDEPQHMPGMADRWSHIPLFWKAYADRDVATLATICKPCPDTYYGVKKLRLFSRLD